MSISAQATLALDLMAAVPRVGLAARDRQWSTLLDTLLTPVPNFLQQAVVNLPESEDGCLDGYASDKIVIGFAPDKDAPDNYILANMWVKRTHTSGTRAEDAPAYVSEVTLTASVAIAGDTGPTSFDGFRGAAGFAPIERLRFYVREGNALDEQGMQSLLRSLLRREQLTWALERGILRLQRSVLDEEANTWDEAAYFDSSSILRALGNHLLITIDDTTPTLDDDEYAEYLSLFFEEDMDDYLRRLPALRSERAMAKARSALEEMPGSPGVQDAAAMTQRTNAAEGEGDEPSRETEGRA
ncbi:hypothetical protein PsYK624_032780 [Phanerochaete sordida]|uniref:Uncharacterized protein n=1 Tax=Phanerochaete sordida TaxID=48140 RepID=A0A9P3G3Z5_9APHY|nr:hypothetical protein PsYK624_032780 [Phanerochaete sordida]